MIDKSKVEKFNEILKSQNFTIVCAESITAGLLASTIASVSGASSVLKGSIVTYSENLKMNLLGVNPLIIARHTAESQETTDAMCLGLKKLYPEASIHVAVTGVASLPADDQYKIDKKVGQIYVSIFHKNKFKKFATIIQPHGEDIRNSIRTNTVLFILKKILKVIQKYKQDN